MIRLPSRPTRRDLLAMIGASAGGAVMYQAMASLGMAQESPYTGPPKLDGDVNGTTVLILGAGLAGMTAALELRAAGYRVRILEYRDRAGGRNWTLRGGDEYTELGGNTQQVGFADGNYLNPGPWRIPYHHHAVLDYCKRLGVVLEPFIQVNHNAWLHSASAFGGKPQRYRHIDSDFRGGVAELLAKVVNQDALDQPVAAEDKEILLEALRSYGVLDENLAYRAGVSVSEYRGWSRDPGGGLSGEPEPSEPLAFREVVSSRLWRHLSVGSNYEFQMPMFQPVGGMDMIGQAFERELGRLITYRARVTTIRQDEQGVTVTWESTDSPGTTQTTAAQYCICTIPFSILGQIDHNFSGPVSAAINAMYYEGSVKTGLEMKRRFWEQDEAIFGGISYTDLPISLIAYPSTGFFTDGPAVLLGGYTWGAFAYEFNAMPPEERVRRAIEFGRSIHPQYDAEFSNGISVSWHRVPWMLGCFGIWRDRAGQYEIVARGDGRTYFAGEHVSHIPAWQEGAILSAIDTISRLHQRVVNG
jgi:monoamine oxidase